MIQRRRKAKARKSEESPERAESPDGKEQETTLEARQICDSLVHETEGVRACVILDLKTGRPLATSRQAAVDDAETDRAIRIGCDVLRSKLLRQYAALLDSPQPVEHLVREAQVSTTKAHVYLATVPNLADALLICATEKTVNIGFGWIAVHRAIDQLAQAPAPALEPEPEPVDTQATAADTAPTVSALVPEPPARRQRQAARRGATAPPGRGPRPDPARAAKPAEGGASAPTPPAQPEERADDAPQRAGRIGARAVFGAKPREGDN